MTRFRPIIVPLAFTLGVWLAAAGPGASAFETAQAETSGKITASHEIAIRDRKVVGDDVIRVVQGDVVRLKWVSDEDVALHLHGYDVETEASPDSPGFMRFTARATGRFPVNSHGFGGEDGHGHGHGEPALLYIEVHPK